MSKINCFKCKYFYITYQETFPYGCKLMAFKSKVLPSKEVLSASGEECKGFESKVLKYSNQNSNKNERGRY